MIDDEYGHLSSAIPESKENESESKGKDKRDKATVRREEFLNIYKEENNAGQDGEDGGPDLSNGIKFKREEEDSGFTLKTSPDSGQGKPLIQELDSVETSTTTTPK